MPRNVPALEAKAAVAELMSHDWKLRLPQKNVMSIAGGVSVSDRDRYLPMSMSNVMNVLCSASGVLVLWHMRHLRHM